MSWLLGHHLLTQPSLLCKPFVISSAIRAIRTGEEHRQTPETCGLDLDARRYLTSRLRASDHNNRHELLSVEGATAHYSPSQCDNQITKYASELTPRTGETSARQRTDELLGYFKMQVPHLSSLRLRLSRGINRHCPAALHPKITLTARSRGYSRARGSARRTCWQR